MKKLFMMSLVPALLWSGLSFADAAGSTYDTSQAKFQEGLVSAERDYIDCVYPSLILNELTSYDINNHFQQPSEEFCAQNKQAFTDALLTAKNAPVAPHAFPLYQELLLNQTVPTLSKHLQEEIGAPTLLTSIMAPAKRTSLKSIALSTFAYEDILRDKDHLNVNPKDLRKEGSDCQQDISSYKQIASQSRYDQTVWHQILLDVGYPCTAKIYKELSLELNGDGGASQALLEKNVEDTVANLSAKLKGKLQNVLFVYFPQLAYDVPFSHFENLTNDQLQKGLEAVGAQFKVVDRISLSDTDSEIVQSRKSFQRILAENPGKKVIALGRSYGGLIVREVLEGNPELQHQVNGVILIGTTPWGSVIADFKSRADLFDDAFTSSDGLNAFFSFFLGFHAFELDQQAMVRTNYTSMSSVFVQPIQTNDAVPVMTVISLPQNLQGYYNGSTRIAGVDQTFMLMSMYGPTEGSSPLAGAAWDTSNSQRLFYEKYNHLGFWELSPDDAIHLYYSTINSALESGLIKL